MKENKSAWASIIFILFAFQLLCSMIPLVSDSSNVSIKAQFPRALQIIEDDAFSATALEKLVFGDELLYIGERAFQNDSDLKEVFIPKSVLFIGEFAFPENTDLVIYGIRGSYAQKWAEDNYFVFKENDIWTAVQLKKTVSLKLILLLWIICFVNEETLLRLSEYTRKYIKSMRPQDRSELYPINYRFP